MRWVSLAVCTSWVAFGALPLSAQLPEPRFDPTPVFLPKASPGAAARPVTGVDLLALRQVYGMSISPDGTKIAFVLGQADRESDSYRSGLFVANVRSLGAPKCLGSAGTPHWDSINQWLPEAPQWSADGSFLTYRMRMTNEESWQVWRSAGELDGMVQLTHVPGDVIGYRQAGRKLILTVLRPAGARESELLLARGIHYDQRFLPWQGMPVLLASLTEQSRATETWVHDLDTGKERKATATEERAEGPSQEELQRLFDEHRPEGADACRVEGPKLSPDGQTAAFLCFTENAHDTGTFSWNLFAMNLPAQEVHRITSVYIISDYWWSVDGHQLYYVPVLGDGRSNSIQEFNTSTGKSATHFRGSEFLKQFSMDRAGRLIACTRESNVHPPDIAVVDILHSTVSTVVTLNPEFLNLRVSEAGRIAGVNKNGEEWFGHVVKPLGYVVGKKYPLVITTYRSGDYFLLGASGNENPIQVYAAYGFVVLSFDIGRFRKRREHDFADRLLDWASPTESMAQAIALLTKQGLVDPARVGVTGFSHGAEIVEYAISHTALFRAAVLSGPAARDPYFYYMAGDEWQATFEKWGLGGWPEGVSAANWKTLAASLNADHINTALLVNASDSEYIADLSLVTSLTQLKKPVDLYVYAHELHVKNGPRHRREIYERNVDWFRFWLKGEEDSTPEKAAQYEYWRTLRNAARPAIGAP